MESVERHDLAQSKGDGLVQCCLGGVVWHELQQGLIENQLTHKMSVICYEIGGACIFLRGGGGFADCVHASEFQGGILACFRCLLCCGRIVRSARACGYWRRDCATAETHAGCPAFMQVNHIVFQPPLRGCRGRSPTWVRRSSRGPFFLFYCLRSSLRQLDHNGAELTV